MILRLKKLLTTFKSCFKKNQPSEKISELEKIVRSVFSPINIHKNKGTLLPNAFKPPYDSEDLSVNRLDYTTPHFCKKISIKNENPEKNRSYFGFAILLNKEISELECSVVYTPIYKPKALYNVYHSDIKIGHIVKRGEPLPSKISKKIDDLSIISRLYVDPNPKDILWKGDVLL